VRFLVVREAARREDAEDAVEEAMSDAFLNWATIENPEAWVRRAARNALVTRELRRLDQQRRSTLIRQSHRWQEAVLRAYDRRLLLACRALGIVEHLDALEGMDREIERLRVEGVLQGTGLRVRNDQ
jgi:DNA-directed RNA polymerase specialized sigma24 family protein